MELLCKKCGKKIESGESQNQKDIRIIDDLLPDVCNDCLSPDEMLALNNWISSCTCKRDG